jgi:iron complex transport system permease protein
MTKHIIPISIVICTLAIIAAFMWGGTTIPLAALFTISKSSPLATIIFDIRLPRIILACTIGAGLSVSGTVYQAVLRNPLAEPYTLGIAGGASLGVALGSLVSPNMLSFTTLAIIGALVSTSIIYYVGTRKQFASLYLILTGIMITIITSSLVLALAAVADGNTFYKTMLWLMGTIHTTSLYTALIITLIVSILIAILTFLYKEIDILTLGSDHAQHLGVAYTPIMRSIILITALITALCVAYAGVIGFIGIIIPHIMRRITGTTHRVLIPVSALCGAAFLTTADMVARRIAYPVVIPVGVITGIIGGIGLIIIITRSRAWRVL